MEKDTDIGPTVGEIAREMRALRESLGLSQTEVGRLMGISLDTVYVYEGARRPIPVPYRVALRGIVAGVVDLDDPALDAEIVAKIRAGRA